MFESEKYRKDKVSTDGGDSFTLYEVGSSLTLNPKKNIWTGVGNFERTTDGFGSYSGGAFSSTGIYGSYIGNSAMYIKASPTIGGSNYGGISRDGFPSLTVGQVYTLSLYAKGISNLGSIHLSNQSGRGDESCLSFSFSITSDWQRYSKTCTLDFVKPTLYIWSNNQPNQEWIIDALQVEPGG